MDVRSPGSQHQQPAAGFTPQSSDKAGSQTSRSDAGGFSTEVQRTGDGPGRKPKACRECKRLKIKCELEPGDKQCTRCARRNLHCISNRPSYVPAAAAAPEGYEWKIDQMREEIRYMRAAFDALIRQNNFRSQDSNNAEGSSLSFKTDQRPSTSSFDPSALTTQLMNPRRSPNERGARDPERPRMAMTRENSPEPQVNEDQLQTLVSVAEPINSLYEVTRLRNIRSNTVKSSRPESKADGPPNDFITRGVISEKEAEELYTVFHTSLNHYLWVGLEQIHSDLLSVRRSSSLLTATILAVTALHIPTSATTFDICYNEFLSLVSSSMFSRYHCVDDVRGLCIAAFWLSDVSWKLSGHATRIATELGIHQSFYYALQGNREHYLNARLWYMLYVCDHHFSIAYGRPPMIGESLQIREHEVFLQSPLAHPLDFRLLSQVALFQVLTRIHDYFAQSMLPQQDSFSTMLPENHFSQMRTFNLEIDQWRMRWQMRQKNNDFIGTFPPKGIVLYSYFAKLQLNSFAVRGLNIRAGSLSTERKEFANMAISAAASILTFVLEEQDLRRALVGTPLYVHSMIAFASVFLMKVATKWNMVGFNVEPTFVWTLVERMISLLKNTITSDRHLLYHIAAGLEKMLAKSKLATDVRDSAGSDQVQAQSYASQAYSDDRVEERMSLRTANGTYAPSVEDMHNTGVDFDQIMNPGLIYDAFGGESADGVYSMLTTQFS